MEGKKEVMRVYSIFDDYPQEAVALLAQAGMGTDVHPRHTPRPDHDQMKKILEKYDCVIIGTSQKIEEDMFEKIEGPRIIATASIGVDHIRVPEEKKHLVTVFNTPASNALSVAEYTIGCALSCVKRLHEGRTLYLQGKDNKQLFRKPEDLSGKTMGVVGAGNISVLIQSYARMMGMNVLCWTKHPENHKTLEDTGVSFVALSELAERSDVISVNLPNKEGTRNLISREIVRKMKDTGVFISVSRLQTVDTETLFEKAKAEPGFYVCLDIDVDEKIVRDMPDIPNVCITPHIAGGTKESRQRMFMDLAKQLAGMSEQSV